MVSTFCRRGLVLCDQEENFTTNGKQILSHIITIYNIDVVVVAIAIVVVEKCIESEMFVGVVFFFYQMLFVLCAIPFLLGRLTSALGEHKS